MIDKAHLYHDCDEFWKAFEPLLILIRDSDRQMLYRVKTTAQVVSTR